MNGRIGCKIKSELTTNRAIDDHCRPVEQSLINGKVVHQSWAQHVPLNWLRMPATAPTNRTIPIRSLQYPTPERPGTNVIYKTELRDGHPIVQSSVCKMLWDTPTKSIFIIILSFSQIGIIA